jgi:DNA-3-methyladenine glycosylase I
MGREIIRCSWCGEDPIYQKYHDEEWGRANYDDQHLFEMLLLEGAQAGLSWITVLRKRAHYRKVYDQFNPEKIARYTEKKQQNLLQDPGIIRNRLKVAAFKTNAQAYLEIQNSEGSFSDFIWQFTDGQVIVNNPRKMSDVPATSAESDQMSKVLKKRGFKFIGSTICYAFMQACGMVDDHMIDCSFKP